MCCDLHKTQCPQTSGNFEARAIEVVSGRSGHFGPESWNDLGMGSDMWIEVVPTVYVLFEQGALACGLVSLQVETLSA